MKTKEPYTPHVITLKKNGGVDIRNALIFMPREYGCIYVEKGAKNSVISGCYLISIAPKWWQVIQWIKLAVMIKGYVK